MQKPKLEQIKKLKINVGCKNGMWKGNKALPDSARYRAKRLIPNIPERHEIHHIDGNVYNNNPSNLLIVTRKEHMILDGRLEWIRHHGYKWKKGDIINPDGKKPKNGLFSQTKIKCKDCRNIEKVDDSYICMDNRVSNSSSMTCVKRYGYYGKNPERKRHCDYYTPL
jgi:hypothetical protein